MMNKALSSLETRDDPAERPMDIPRYENASIVRQAGFDAGPRRHRRQLLECVATAAQRLELGTRIAAVGGEIL